VTNDGQTRRDQRLLVLPPTSKDGALTREWLSPAGIATEIVPTLEAIAQELNQGAAAILIPEEALAGGTVILSDVIRHQPPWSDLPVLVLTRPGADSADVTHAMQVLGNVTLIERPVRVATLVSVVRTALRARERQYQIRAYLAERVRAEAALRDADRRKDEFLATLGHELRNPLSPLLTSLHLLKVAGATKPIPPRTLAVMQRQVNHLIRLVDDLLDVSRITRGIIDIAMEPVELVSVLAGAIENSRVLVDASRQEVIADLSNEPIMIKGDAVRLTQLFSNLINNAAKYSEVGGHIWIAAHRNAHHAIVTIRDDGIGIAPDHLETVFDMFTQVNRSARRAQGGLGIGLTLARSLAAAHGGSVAAMSDGPGRGSTFEVRLPLTSDQPFDEDPLPDLKKLPSRRVLVVDDNHDAAETLGTLLSALGATVCTVHSGTEALNIIDNFGPDVVLLDIGMPGMDGYEVARRIRATSSAGNAMLIALTGWGQEEDIQRSEVAGFDYHLVKPPDMDKLWQLMSSPLRHRRNDPHHGSGIM
jgi:signal transduction histidine kinase/CheY-like chemotaxis protein